MKLVLKIFFITVTLLVSFQNQVVAAPCSSSEIIISRTADDNNPGSLRYAINQALASSTPLSLCANGNISTTLSSPLPLITRSFTLRASDNYTLTITRSTATSADLFSLFRIDSPSNNISVNLENITFSNGAAYQGGVSISDIRLYGGAVYVGTGDSLIGNNLVFNNNRTYGNGYGGALMNDGGSITLSNSTFSNNSTPSGGGGAIYNTSTATLTLNKVQCYSNTATERGGCVSNYGNLTINNSTFVNNSSSSPGGHGGGGALHNVGTATLRNVSFVNNFAITGGGILNEPDTYHSLPGRIILVNTVVAYNRTNATSHNDCLNSGGTLISRGNNLIQAPGNCTLTNDTSNFGSADLLNADPIYENIAGDTYSGGNIPAPLLTSPLIDRGKQDECVASNNTVTDILGEVRLGPCDIGAVESKLNISLPSVSISIPESSTTVSLRINQSFTTVPNTIQYTTQDETATSGRDYVASSGSITFPPYITSNNLTLNLAPDDTVHDGDKTFLVILSSSTPGVNISYSRLIARITIIDNDPLPPSTGGSSGGAGTGGAGGSSGSSGSGGFGSGGASATGGASGGSGGQTEISTGGTGGQESIGSGGTDDTDPLQDNTEQETGGSTDSGTGGSTVNEDNTPLIPNAGGCSIAQG